MAKHVFREGNRTTYAHDPEYIEQPYPDLIGDNSAQGQLRFAQLRLVVFHNREQVDSLPLFNQQFSSVIVNIGSTTPQLGFYIDVTRSDGGGVEWVFDDQGCAQLCPALGQANIQQPIARNARGVRDWWAAQLNTNLRNSQE